MKKLLKTEPPAKLNKLDKANILLYNEWNEKFSAALNNMQRYSIENNGVLIEVAAQHPLKDGYLPNDEFAARLEYAMKTYDELIEAGTTKVFIYIPGSIHISSSKQDKISLSEAGKRYLVEHGINQKIIFGDDANIKYKGDEGVYNSSDECFVATQLFLELECRQLYCVCSPAQLMRKALSYIAFGIVPEMYSVPREQMFHNYIEEVFINIPILLRDENGLQQNNEEATRLRQLRKPKG